MKQDKNKINRLIKRIQKGERDAFEELYKLTSARAYFLIFKIVQDEHDAQDILQESYIKMLAKIHEIDVSQNFMSWFYKIALNKSKDFLKTKNRISLENDEDDFFENLPEEDAAFCPEESLDRDELCREVMEAVDELTFEKRACIIMMYFEQMSVSEIAESLGVPISTVKNRLFTARKDLKAKFEKKNTAVLYSAAPVGILVMALNEAYSSVSATFTVGSASAGIMASAGSSLTSAASGAASVSSGIAAKAAALSVAQKIAAGAAAAVLVGGSAAGVATVVKNQAAEDTAVSYTEEVTTAPQITTKFFAAELTSEEESMVSGEFSSSAKAETPTSQAIRETKPTPNTATNPTAPSTTKVHTTMAATTEKADQTTKTTTIQAPSTTVTHTENTTKELILIEKTTATTTQAPATLIIEVTDHNENVIDTITVTVEAGTALTWDYLINLVSQNGYEAMAGIYGDGIDTAVQEGKTYTFTAEL